MRRDSEVGLKFKVLITGVCGFVGSAIAKTLLDIDPSLQVVGIDNLARTGSARNWRPLQSRGVQLFHGDLRVASDLAAVGRCDWVIDAAALPSVVAGVDGRHSSRQVVETNLMGTLHLLEQCATHRSGLILLSTSRVYSIAELNRLPLNIDDNAFQLSPDVTMVGASTAGISEAFSTRSPISMYGATKLASETMALEYGLAYQFPVWINRCGVLAGAGQFGRPDQGIFAYWIHSHLRRRPLKYIGFAGQGTQVRDCLHPQDLARLLYLQMTEDSTTTRSPVLNVSGGIESAISLHQLTQWCDDRFGPHAIAASTETRAFDLPWIVLDSSRAKDQWNWEPKISVSQVLDEIAAHATANPDWLETSN
ncbi:CDP-paratose 2-epimerase [Rosistilla carotiformis]|uniref:CDP-paratose 2-epimerase n=1 Tax=Rosistilla carotiformis TaxID=2528017 RepID=A0A518JV87_9BACT|nr:NAD-dependent epimerase/dehydratase family protein [Rosistilla carotiformis]QDV69461.1 CDP-paratose 2-epimerase [Rosistilla carotiformis]